MSGTFVTQVRQNLVAIISLVVAVSGFSYNTWRNERSEENRNIRQAGFEVLLKLGELQEIVFLSHYDMDEHRGNPRSGWANVLLIGDLSENIPEPVPIDALALRQTWNSDWQGLGSNDESAENISESIDSLRGAVLQALRQLD